MITIHPISSPHIALNTTSHVLRCTKMIWDHLRPSDYILTTFWLHSGYILATFWLHSDYILATFWQHSDYIMTTCWLHSDCILTTFWLNSGFILTTFWLHSGYILATFWLHLAIFWLHFGYILAIFWLHFGYIDNCWRSVPLPCGQYMAIFNWDKSILSWMFGSTGNWPGCPSALSHICISISSLASGDIIWKLTFLG